MLASHAGKQCKSAALVRDWLQGTVYTTKSENDLIILIGIILLKATGVVLECLPTVWACRCAAPVLDFLILHTQSIPTEVGVAILYQILDRENGPISPPMKAAAAKMCISCLSS